MPTPAAHSPPTALLQRRQAAQSAAAAKQVDVRSARLPKFRS